MGISGKTSTSLAATLSGSRITGDVPVGAYDPSRLSNIAIGHGGVDAGLGSVCSLTQD